MLMWAHVVFGLPACTVGSRQIRNVISMQVRISSLYGSVEVSAEPRIQVGANENEAALAFDEADFPSLGGGPARPAGGAPDGGGNAMPSPPSAQASGAHSIRTVFVRTISFRCTFIEILQCNNIPFGIRQCTAQLSIQTSLRLSL